MDQPFTRTLSRDKRRGLLIAFPNEKNILLNSDTSHLDLDHQSDYLFSQIPLYSAIRNYGGHAPWAIKMSRILSHSVTALNNYFTAFYSYLCKGKEEMHATMLQRRPCTILEEDVIFFVYFLSACVLMRM